MKKIFLLTVLALSLSSSAFSQKIFNEVKRIMDKQEVIKKDKSKSLDERKVATFKHDAIYYLILKASESDTFTEYQLGQQTNAMIEFLNIYFKRLSIASTENERDLILTRFKNATLHHALFNDTEKDVAFAYVDNSKFITQFSLDCDWMDALKEIKD